MVGSGPAGQPASSAASERGAEAVQYGTGETLRRSGGGEVGAGRRCPSGVHVRLLPALASCVARKRRSQGCCSRLATNADLCVVGAPLAERV